MEQNLQKICIYAFLKKSLLLLREFPTCSVVCSALKGQVCSCNLLCAVLVKKVILKNVVDACISACFLVKDKFKIGFYI